MPHFWVKDNEYGSNANLYSTLTLFLVRYVLEPLQRRKELVRTEANHEQSVTGVSPVQPQIHKSEAELKTHRWLVAVTTQPLVPHDVLDLPVMVHVAYMRLKLRKH